MDPAGKSMEDQFSKLHPCFPTSTRIAIVGAGPSGLSAAYALIKLGYTNITVLEKHHTVGGMCESIQLQGRTYDLGGQVLAANSAPVIFHLAKEMEMELEEMDSHKLALINSCTGKYQDLQVADDYLSLISLTLKLQDEAKKSNRIGVYAVSELASDPTLEFLQLNGLKSLPKSVVYGYTASGYGFIQDMPYAYVHEFTRTSMAGKIRRFKGGYTSLWKKISQSLPIELQCSCEVSAIRRNSSLGIHVDVKNLDDGSAATLEFDKIIISGSFPFQYGMTYRSRSTLNSNSIGTEGELMELSELEKDLFRRVVTIDYYTTVLKIKGLEHLPMGFYYFGEFMEDSANIGHPVAMQRFYDDTDIFLFWSYGNSEDITGETVEKLAIDVVMKIGGRVEKTMLQRRFKYFPHVTSQDMRDGFYEKLELEIQGMQNTFYVGGLMAFELTERNSSYAMALVCKHFANANSVPAFPYVKSMLPSFSNGEFYKTRELHESLDSEFPNLSTLDCYLKHWGTHEMIQNKVLYSWINEKGEAIYKRTYGQLHSNASHIAHRLLTNRKPVFKAGDRVLLIYVPGLEFIDAFFGCLRAKIVPVPVLPPDPLQRGGQALLKIENISKACNAVAILSTIGYHAAVCAGSVKSMISLTKNNGKCSARWPNLPWLCTDSWIKSSKAIHPKDIPNHLLETKPGDICFLQFTSGSTGDAKGVMITHGGLVHNVKVMKKRYKSNSGTVLVSWLPQYHDMGLIGGLFTAMVSGGSAILFSPITFIRNPLLWLQTISQYQATHSAGPNFAFELLIRKLECDKERAYDYDLSSLVFLMIAAEPVRQKTLKRFIELTQPFGLLQQVLAPGYGLAENCVFVSCAFGEGKPIIIDWEGRVCCGYVDPNDPDIDIRIVDPETGKEHYECGKEGEIWISSPSAGIGYWGKQELSQKTFRNELENQPGKIYTRTGDLGRTIDRKLFITGRIKDIIIVGGRNIYSADVEKTVESSSELLRPGCCAVIGVPEEILLSKGITVPESSDQVGLVVIAEVREGKSFYNKEIIEEIHTRITEEHGIPVAAVKLIKPKTMSKTTSGKIKRFECLKQFTEETLSLATEPKSYKERKTRHSQLIKTTLQPSTKLSKIDIIEFLRGLVSEQTKVPLEKISATENLVSYGIDSIGVVRAAQKLSCFLGVPVGAVDIFTATCIEDLATFSENLVMKSQSQNTNNRKLHPLEVEMDHVIQVPEISRAHLVFTFLYQLLAIIYGSALLIIPIYLSVYSFLNLLSDNSTKATNVQLSQYMIPLALAPLAWILCMLLTCISISLFGNSFLQLNHTLISEIPIWSTDFVRWWTLYKVQEVVGKVLAVHLRGTIFLNYWFKILGARIGSSVLLDTVDITDPSLVSIGDGVVIAEGALIQSHEVKNGVLSFLPIKIGNTSYVGPYAVLQKGSILEEKANVQPLQKTEGGISIPRTNKYFAVSFQKGQVSVPFEGKVEVIFQSFGIYMVGFLSSFSAAILYYLHIQLSRCPPSIHHFAFACLIGAFHWFPATIVAYATMFSNIPSKPITTLVSVAIAYLVHGIILTLVTGISLQILCEKRRLALPNKYKTWLRNRIAISCHLKFGQFLSGTEAFCMWLRFLGAKLGRHCSIRAINPICDPELILIGNGVHLGDFCRILPGFYSAGGYHRKKVEIQDNSVVGSQSLVLPGSVIQKDVILGALSIAPVDSVLQTGGVYVGSDTPIMVKNSMYPLDNRIEEMDVKYKKIVGNLAANLAITTKKVKSRYFHRIGVSGKGVLKVFDNIEGLPNHKIFHPGKSFPVVIRHSNSLSADDDARIDARGAALRILSKDGSGKPLLDLTLKTGKAFYARTISDFATWLVCGLEAREEHVKNAPHVRDAVWDSLRNTDSYTNLHYYSNICRIFRFEDGQEMYVKFKLRPFDNMIGEDSGKVEPIGILPPETGAIPRDTSDTRPLLFLADDFQSRVNSQNAVRYVLQLQLQPVPQDVTKREIALDCTKPWNQTEFPFVDIGEIAINQILTREESEALEFNPFLRCHEVDVIRATSCSQSASIDHGRSLVYEICQHLRNNEPIPKAWRVFLEQSDVKVDLSECPLMPTATPTKESSGRLTLERSWYVTLWAMFCQPLLQILLPYMILGLAVFAPLNWFLYMKEEGKVALHILLPFFWACSGTLAGLLCALAKWALVGKKKEGEAIYIWSREVFLDTIWQAVRSLVGEYFMDMTSGSILFGVWMKLMGSSIEFDQGGVYVDSKGAVLNPEMVEIERGGSVGRDAVLFGHIYEGEEGKVKFGKIKVREGGFVGSRAVVMPGVTVDSWGNLGALSIAMKEETVR